MPQPLPRADRGPLRVMFLLTSMEVGGAETLLVNLIRGLDRARFSPEVACLKERGPLGEMLSGEIPVHAQLLGSKFDVSVVGRLRRLFQARKIDAVVTVGCGDKMFWGRLAAWRAKLPVIASALHSTGWPDGVGRLNRMLTSVTDAFIGVANAHGIHLVDVERFPAEKVHVIVNGIDTQRFCPHDGDRTKLRRSLGLPVEVPLATIVAALRPEKNHRRFLEMASIVHRAHPSAQFVIVGEGPTRVELKQYARELDIADFVHFLGNRHDIPELLRCSDVFVLTSDNEAAPVSILEASASGIPVLAPHVGSVHELVVDGQSGYLLPLDANAYAKRLLELFANSVAASTMGSWGRDHVVHHGSLESMVEGYQQLLESIYDRKAERSVASPATGKQACPSTVGSR